MTDSDGRRAKEGKGDGQSAARLATILFILAFIVLSVENLFRKKNEGKFFSFDLSSEDIKIFPCKPTIPFLIILFFIFITLFIPVLWLISNSISLIIEDSKALLYFSKASFNSILLAFLGAVWALVR